MAQRLGCAFIETSAKERINVDEAFIGLVGEIKKYQVSIFPKGLTMCLRMECPGVANDS